MEIEHQEGKKPRGTTVLCAGSGGAQTRKILHPGIGWLFPHALATVSPDTIFSCKLQLKGISEIKRR